MYMHLKTKIYAFITPVLKVSAQREGRLLLRWTYFLSNYIDMGYKSATEAGTVRFSEAEDEQRIHAEGGGGGG